MLISGRSHRGIGESEILSIHKNVPVVPIETRASSVASDVEQPKLEDGGNPVPAVEALNLVDSTAAVPATTVPAPAAQPVAVA